VNWRHRLLAFRRPSGRRASVEILTTLVPFGALWLAMLWAVNAGHWWLCAVLAPLAGAFLVRVFMIQHDCGHGSFVPDRAANDLIGRLLSILTLTPYDHWRTSHAMHHATVGHLDRRGFGDLWTMTVPEYQASSRWQRFLYRLYRHPLVLFGLGPGYMFLLAFRLPLNSAEKGLRPWLTTMATNLGIVAFATTVIALAGVGPFLLVHLPVVLIGATIGVWLFYVQHQFEGTYWRKAGDWQSQDAALQGSTFYDLPPVLRWLTANIGMHHVHHLASGVPFYRLPDVLRAYPELKSVGRLTFWQSLRCTSLALWDEDARRLVPFSHLRRLAAA
jgi:omega-6 fatty acid desaturase (delta-12 desaturase)